MANPYKATFKDGSGVERLEGSIDFTDPQNQPGGGSQPLTFPLAFDDAGLSDGVVKWTPSVDTWIRGAWFHTTVAWDGTTPLLDFGAVADGKGLYAAVSQGGLAADATQIWQPAGDAPSFIVAGGGSSQLVLSYVADPYNGGAFPLPILVPAGTPVAVWCSQDGIPGGADPGAAQGTSALVIDAVPA